MTQNSQRGRPRGPLVTFGRIKRKPTYTTGDVSRALNVSPGTVTKWMNGNLLPSFRIPKPNPSERAPGDRRCTLDALRHFARSRGIPLIIEGDEPTLVLVSNGGLMVAQTRAGGEAAGYAVLVAPDWFRAGMAVLSTDYSGVFIDLSMGRSQGIDCARWLREHRPYVKVTLLAAEDEGDVDGLRGVCDDVVCMPCSLEECVRSRFAACTIYHVA